MQNRFFLTTIMLLCISDLLFAQSSNQNYILTRTFMDKEGTLSKSLQTVQYFDGLGRPVQTVQKAFTPDGKDLALMQEYDDFGRNSNSWLPAPQTTNSGNFVELAAIKSSSQAFYGGDNATYSKPVYEASPLSRVIKQYRPGSDWHNNNKFVNIEYSTNNINGVYLCIKYTISGNSLQKSGTYPANQLYITKITSEDDCEI